MTENTKIEWCHHTFNPVWGCAKVSPGCDNCYAERDAHRFGTPWGVNAKRREFGDKHWNDPLRWNRKAEQVGERHRVFCASMADVFDKNWPTGTRERLWDLIRSTPNLDWLLLTKRIGNAKSMLPSDWGRNGYDNVWLGASVVNQEEAFRDIPKLLMVPASVRFLSCEPLIGPIDLDPPICQHCLGHEYDVGESGLKYCSECSDPDIVEEMCHGVWLDPLNDGLHWVIVGGESGPKARPLQAAWVRAIRDQCQEEGVPFLFKQWGEYAPGSPLTRNGYGVMKLVGKVAAGRMLDGRLWDDYPEHHLELEEA